MIAEAVAQIVSFIAPRDAPAGALRTNWRARSRRNTMDDTSAFASSSTSKRFFNHRVIRREREQARRSAPSAVFSKRKSCRNRATDGRNTKNLRHHNDDDRQREQAVRKASAKETWKRLYSPFKHLLNQVLLRMAGGRCALAQFCEPPNHHLSPGRFRTVAGV